MFDTMTLTKVVGGFCGAFLVFLLAAWGSEALYHSDGGHGEGAGDAYPIEVAAVTDVGVEEGPAFAELLAVADAGKGERVFRKCQACHAAGDGENGTGPHLHAIVGREIASAAGFEFSGALLDLEGAWTPEALDGFLANPKQYAPGTAMSFIGLKKAEDRANLVAYMQSFID